MKTSKICLIILCLLPVRAVGLPQFGGANFFMKTIIINSAKHGQFKVLLDDEDYDKCIVHDWRINWHSPKRTYAMTNIRDEKGKIKTYKMHRYIMGLPDYNIDHIDGNGLNNQKSNFRKCNCSQNGFNRGLNKNNTTGYKGVVLYKAHKRKKPYHSQIKINRETLSLGYYSTAEAAALAYNKAALKYIGEFAYLNNV